jgi:hypothetical protein
MLTYERSDNIEIVDYSNSDYVECLDIEKFTSGQVMYSNSQVELYRGISPITLLLHHPRCLQSL